MTEKKQEYITTSQAEKIYQVENSNIRKRLVRGTLEGYKLDPDNEKSPWLVLVEDLDKNFKKKS